MLKVTQIRWLFGMALAALLFVVATSNEETLGIMMASSGAGYRFAAGTNPQALACSMMIFLLYFALMYAPPLTGGKSMPGLFRRFVAFCCDFFLALMASAPVIGLAAVLKEWKHTRDFNWSFERSTPVRGDDALGGIGFLMAGVAMFFYFAWPLVRSKPTPGACIAGYQVVPEDGTSLHLGQALLRNILGFIAVCVWYLAFFLARDRKKGQFWLDKVFRTRAVFLK